MSQTTTIDQLQQWLTIDTFIYMIEMQRGINATVSAVGGKPITIPQLKELQRNLGNFQILYSQQGNEFKMVQAAF